MLHETEDSFVVRAKSGAVDAWEHLIAEYQEILHEHIRCNHPQWLAAYVTSEDILQEALLQAWLDIRSLKGNSTSVLIAWLKTVADRRILQAIATAQTLKRGGGMQRMTRSTSEDDGWFDLLDVLPAEAKTASSILSRKETRQALQAALQLLPDAQQIAIRLHYLELRTVDQTAAELKCSAAAVRGLLHRGKKSLARDLASASSWLGARSNVTRLLAQIDSGNCEAAAAAEELLPLVYDELRKLAAGRLRHEKPGQTLDATALVHEAYVRLVESDRTVKWDSRGHFFAAAAEAMRRILVERARRKRSGRYGGGLVRHAAHEIEIAAPMPAVDLLSLNEALERLEARDRAKAELVKLRYFAGLTLPQAADALGISTTTADRYWAYARAWLHTQMKKGTDNDAD